MDKFNVFTISIYSFNLISFMLGMTFAFFHQGMFGRSIGKYVIFYWIGMFLYYFALNYIATNHIKLQ